MAHSSVRNLLIRLKSETEKRLHINLLELKAVLLSLKHFRDQCSRQEVMVASDNTSVVAYINKQGGTRLSEMYALLWQLMAWCTKNLVSIRARHIPRCLNVLADSLSRRNQIQSTEWSLNPTVVRSFFKRWGTPHVDLFATRHNHKLPLFVSPVPDPLAWEVEALHLDWTGLLGMLTPQQPYCPKSRPRCTTNSVTSS